MENTAPTAIIIAGPNGAGKTTFAQEFLPEVDECKNFINADYLAHALSPLRPESQAFRAGRLMLQLISESVERNESFAIETTLSSKNYLSHIKSWKAKGYQVTLIFISLDSADTAIKRVAQRVKEGGHNIPTKTIVRRFHRGVGNFSEYCDLADEWYHYKNEQGTFIIQSKDDG